MTIIQALQRLRDDLKLWVSNNLRMKVDKNLGAELNLTILTVDSNGDITSLSFTKEEADDLIAQIFPDSEISETNEQ